jgi:glycosyltransferase involved in cell wall biosynthesis
MDQDVHLALFSRARSGPSERGLIKQLGLDERVHLLGAWANPELVFQAIDLYIHGPSDDCMPRAVLAAQACGKPVIACPPTPNDMLCPHTGRLTPIQYIPTQLHSLQRALESNAQETTRQFIVDNWNTSRSLERYGALFRQLADHDEPKRLPA